MINSDQQNQEKTEINANNKKPLASKITTTNIVNCKHAKDAQGVAGEELTKLPGVGRKTANIILTYGMNKNQGIAVDTHVRRLSYRMGLTKNKIPDKIEQDLMKQFKKKNWPVINSLLVWHGREICKAQKPLCSKCVLKKCPKIGVTKHG